MRIGLFLTDVWTAGPDSASLWAQQRHAVSAARDSGFAGVSLGQRWLGHPHWNVQPIAAAAYLSASLGSMQMTVRDLRLALTNPVEVAEQIATLDHACEGRLTVSATVAASAVEHEALGADDAELLARTEEALTVIEAVWTRDEITHGGRFWSISGGRSTLRPRQRPGPPMSLSAESETEARFAAHLGCGIHIPAAVPYARIARILDAHGEESARAGPRRFGVQRSACLAYPGDDAGQDPPTRVARCLEALRSYRELGLDHAELWPRGRHTRGLAEEIRMLGERLCAG